jgi:uncharacterized membrane protein YdjX (TVP38/TMEM64 family)
MSVLRKKGELTPDEKRKRLIYTACIVIFLTLSVLICVFVGRPFLKFISEPENFRLWVDSHGIWGWLAFVGVMILQVVVAIIPGEPLELAAGYAFGFWEGTLLCLIGSVAGGILVFLIVRRWGVKVVEIFFSTEKIQSLKFLQDERKLDILIFFLFFIPGTPKDVLTYFVGLTKIRFPTWLLISTIARIPSIVTSTISGDALGLQDYQFAIIAFGVTLVISVLGLLIYNRICSRRQQRGEFK